MTTHSFMPDWRKSQIQMHSNGCFIIQKAGFPYCVNPSTPEYAEVYEYAIEHQDQVEHIPDNTPSQEEQLESEKYAKVAEIKQELWQNDTKMARINSECLLAMIEPTTVSESYESKNSLDVLKYCVEVQKHNRDLMQSVALCETIEEVQKLKPVSIDIAAHLAEAIPTPAKYEVK